MTPRLPARPSYGPLFSKEKDAALVRAGLQLLLEKARNDPKKLKQLQKALRRPRLFIKTVSDALASAAMGIAPRILQHLKTSGPAMLRDRHATLAGFERRLYKAWKRPIDLLEMFIVACAEAGEILSAQWPWTESPDRSLVFDVIRRLQARACQVACEVFTLLKAGYAPAAHARWRTLHETAATAYFIAKYGKDVAERFLAHEHVEALRAARQYQRHCRRLRYRRYSRKEMLAFRRNHDAVLKHYGPNFKDEYGWAAVTLQQKRATFTDIEKTVKLDHLRPFYRMASYPVHATVKSIRFSLALERGQDILLTGPSNLGLVDPGHSTAISLAQITITMVMLRPSTDTIALLRVLLLFTGEIGEAFLKAQRELQARGTRRGRRR